MAASTLKSIAVAPLPLANFSIINIFDYCQLLNDAHTCDNNYNFEIKKGRLMFESRFITNIRFREAQDGGWVVGSSVKAEMKKRQAYDVFVRISKDMKVTDGECLCPGGVRPGCCKHIFGVLAALEDYSRLEMYKAPTEKLQSWHQPKATVVPPIKVSEFHNEGNGSTSAINSGNGPPTPAPDITSLGMASQRLPIFTILNCSSPGILFMDSLFYDKTMPLPRPALSSGIEIAETPPFLTLEEIFFYHQNIKKSSLEEIQDLERQTMAQSCSLWFSLRNQRITASNVYRVMKRKNNFDKLVSDIRTPNDLSHVPAIAFGKTMEPSVKSAVRSKFHEFVFRNTGCVISSTHPYLAASPDGLLFKDEGSSMLLEIKCIFNPNKLSLQELCSTRQDFCLSFSDSDSSFHLKKDHKYYFQILCQLFCSNMSQCLFVVYYSNLEPFFHEVIEFDNEIWSECLLTVRNFYFSHFLKQLL